ncbi:MAG: AsmA family protein [Candidatus Margulisiibacteriota bacterium]
MNKQLKWAGIAAGGLIVFFAALTILMSMLLPLDKIKDFAASKISQMVDREVKIEGVSFNIFKGIKLNGVTVGNNKYFSKDPFITIKAIDLQYAFWPLFQKKIIVHQIILEKPEILIEKKENNVYNFEDLFDKPKTQAAKSKTMGEKPKSQNQNIDLLVNNFAIKGGKIVYHDYASGKSELKKIDLRVSGITLSMIKPMDIKLSAVGNYQNKDIPVKFETSFKIDLKEDKTKLDRLLLSLAGESITGKAVVEDLSKGPKVKVEIKSDKMALDPLLGIFAVAPAEKKEKAKAKPGQLTASLKKTLDAIPKNLSVDLELDFKNTSLQGFKIDKIQLEGKLKDRVIWLKADGLEAYQGKLDLKGRFNTRSLNYVIDYVKLKGVDSTVFTNAAIDAFLPEMLDMKNKVEGVLEFKFSGSGGGVELPQAFDNLKFNGYALLLKGRLKKLKSLESIADQYNISLFKHDLYVKGLKTDLAMSNKVLTVKDLSLEDTDIKLYFKGKLNFNNMRYEPGNRLTAKLSPAVTRDLPREFSVFRDESGFAEFTFELQGPLSRPIPAPVLDKPVEAAIGKLKAKIEAKQIEIETQIKKQAEERSEETKEELKKQAEEKIKEIIKF